MRPFLAAFAFGLTIMIAAAEAEACRIRRPPPLPVLGDFDAIVLTTVTSDDEHSAVLRIDDVLDGRFGERTLRIDFQSGRAAGGGIVITSCGPPGPPVRGGERVVAVLRVHQGQWAADGWMTLEEAGRTDDFFQLYERSRNAPERRRLVRRWRQVNRYRGPVPLSDPEHWLRPHVGALGWVGPDGLAYVQFNVTAEGRIADCALSHVNPPTPHDATICAGIAQRRFAPPLLERERQGLFRVRWRHPVPQP